MSIDIERNWAERPLGMRDVYPQQARIRRQMESTLLDFFDRRGFEMVSSGAFEYIDTLKRGRSDTETNGWLCLFDASGRTVALRPEMTPSIARMAAPLVATGSRTIRWCYAERIYRRTNDPASISWASGKAAESTQVGVEWIGQTGHETDAELLGLCRDGLAHLQLADCQMVVSHALFASSFLASEGLTQASVDSLMNDLARGDHVGFRKRLTDCGVRDDVLQTLISLNPFQPTTLSAALQASLQASGDGQATLRFWNDLVDFAQLMMERGLDEGLSFDLTLARDITYYTGMVFEVFAPGVGAPIALGGRYDDLLAQFGASAPAVGFTFEVERLLTAMTEGAWLHDALGEEATK
jgi:ATP phosphoribosyltransferase regulatory subunit